MGIISFSPLCYISGYVDSERLNHQPRAVCGNGKGESSELAFGLRAASTGSILVGLKNFPERKDTWLSHSVETKRESTPLLRELN